MADRIYPSAKPTSTTNGTTTAPSFPATKSQLYNASRPAYRPQPPKSRRRSRRGFCCCCFLWLILFIVALVFLVAIAAGVFYLVYRPQRPSFSLTTLRLTSLNLTSSSLTSHLDLIVTARNSNKKLVYLYDPISVTATTADSNSIPIGQGQISGFEHDAGNVTVLKTAVVTSKESLDATSAADLKKQKDIPLEIEMETRAGVRIGSVKTKKLGVRVSCGGATVSVPKGKGSPTAGSGGGASCKVKLRIKIWRWYL